MSNAIVVVSRGRSELLQRRGLTLKALEKVVEYHRMLAVRESEIGAYKAVAERYCAGRVLPLPDSCDNWGKVLDAVIRHKYLQECEKICICDDDLAFSYREWGTTRLPALSPDMMDAAFMELFGSVNSHVVHASFRHRAFAQNCVRRLDYNKRGMWTHAVHRQTVIDADLHFAWPGIVMGDFYFQLSAVRKGFVTAVVNSYTADDVVGPYKDKGGCNLYRTAQMRTQAARLLCRDFPEAVRLRKKKTPNGDIYNDVIIRMKAEGLKCTA